MRKYHPTAVTQGEVLLHCDDGVDTIREAIGLFESWERFGFVITLAWVRVEEDGAYASDWIFDRGYGWKWYFQKKGKVNISGWGMEEENDGRQGKEKDRGTEEGSWKMETAGD